MLDSGVYVVVWSAGVLGVGRCAGMLECWTLLERWSAGMLESAWNAGVTFWSAGALECWSAGVWASGVLDTVDVLGWLWLPVECRRSWDAGMLESQFHFQLIRTYASDTRPQPVA